MHIRSFMRAALFATAAAAAAAAPAAAAETETFFNIPGGDLTSALKAYGLQARVPLLYRDEIVSGLRAAPLRGNYAPQQALRLLLRGSGLATQRTPGGVIYLRKASLFQPVATAAQAAVTAAPATAPAPQIPAEAAPAAESPQDIVVTGTSIRGAPPVGSALIQLGRDEIEASTSATTDQLVREVPQIFNFGITDATRGGASGGSNIVFSNSINIRGIAPYATLTLINGRRPVPQGTIGQNVDPSNIPAISLQRIEIIADGTSAVYGSDSVSGVANLILRRRFEGVGVDVQYGIGDAYNTFTANAIVGANWDTGRFTLSGQHSYRSALSGSDRDFYGADLRTRGGGDFRTTQCAPGNIQIGSTSYAVPAGGATPANLAAGSRNLCDVFKATDLLPRREINSAVLTFDQDIGNSVHFFADGLYARRKGYRVSGVATQNLVVPSTNAFFVQPAGTTLPFCAGTSGPRCETVQYSFDGVFGPATSEINSETWQATAGAEIALGKDWNVSVYTTYGKNSERAFDHGRAVNPANLTAALASGNPATAFNPFNTSANNPAVVGSIFDLYINTRGFTTMSDSGAKLDGTLFTLPGGPVKAALGAEYYWLRNVGGQLRGPSGALAGTDLTVSRTVKSAYAELLVPIFGPENAVPGIHRLDIDIAGRIDDYSDVGSTRNPKIGVNWSPVEGLTLHGSYGTSFRAPLLNQIFLPGGNQLLVQTYFDPTANGGAGAAIRGVALTGDGRLLKPETARTWSFGADWTPAALPGASISLSYFDLVYEGQVQGYATNLNILQQENLFRSIVFRGAAAQTQIAQYISQNLPIQFGSLAEAQASQVFVNGLPSNLGVTIARGLDFDVQVPIRTERLGNFRFGIRGTRFFTYKVALTPGGERVESLNTINNPQKFKARAALGWEMGPLKVDLFGNYQNAYDNNLTTPTQRVSAYTTVDMGITYNLGGVLDFAKEARIGLDVTNLFDRNPPFVNLSNSFFVSGGGYDPTSASPIGRVVAVSLKSRF